MQVYLLSVGALGSQMCPLKLELQAVVSYHVTAGDQRASALDHGILCPVLHYTEPPFWSLIVIMQYIEFIIFFQFWYPYVTICANGI